ncbi:MAG TPA: RdgB/HAM1 family non-canonical purine NTP pyrophosphatase [candidate division Zixibacteria bacterium]|nr:RdgB/HAM1 family non-canonical purine NTP pyrophosphatase [candidate division Zixibacteria bacterium]MDD4916759.1 RdgB/HAM1 family non-canonical purine NTP pyrophosphatase [candidate division Zixibacteria bacterium]MDM7973800.1 RdgB/HAM1 family non-canonical purine NTP pyrophosphatase [candidate division Zixibacteria bacterium]HOD65345.1 RdgB/HAM1 family non-canonical purine NTP pyrophosphatase [candidate division Zixibacteria bacterium]HOZ07285.1 RdgB/HAM1 family non-canonical purine NTP py
MQLVLATNNRDKIREIRHLLEDLPITILTAGDFLDFPEIDETGETLEANALLKARGIAAFTDLPALADDSGLEVDALGGQPGVYSSRYAGDNVTYDDNNRKLLEELAGVPRAERTARFRCVIAIDWADGTHETVEGVAEGWIAEDIAPGNGFGYDPVFVHSETGQRFSAMRLPEKSAVSHRGQALRRAREAISARLKARS